MQQAWCTATFECYRDWELKQEWATSRENRNASRSQIVTGCTSHNIPPSQEQVRLHLSFLHPWHGTKYCFSRADLTIDQCSVVGERNNIEHFTNGVFTNIFSSIDICIQVYLADVLSAQIMGLAGCMFV